MHFLIFIPGGRTPDILSDVGLESLRSGAEYTPIPRGPDGSGGLLFGWRVNGSLRCTYAPGEQAWIPAAADGALLPARYFVGLWNAAPPRSGEIARSKVYGGERVTLGDGCEWIVPSCAELPHSMRLTVTGEWQVAPADQFASFVVAAKNFELQLREGRRPGLVEQVEFAIRALALNYRLPREVASHLGLFTTSLEDEGTLRVCFRAAIGAGEEP